MAKTWKDRRVMGESLHQKITRRLPEDEHPAAAMFVFLSLVPGTSERRQFAWC